MTAIELPVKGQGSTALDFFPGNVRDCIQAAHLLQCAVELKYKVRDGRRVADATITAPPELAPHLRCAFIGAGFTFKDNVFNWNGQPVGGQTPWGEDYAAQVRATLTAARAFGHCVDVHAVQDGTEMVISITYRRAS